MKAAAGCHEHIRGSHALAWFAYVGGTGAMIAGLRLSYAYAMARTATTFEHRHVALGLRSAAVLLLTFALVHLCRRTKKPHVLLGICLGAQELLCALLLGDILLQYAGMP
jgi:hypothetical protein